MIRPKYYIERAIMSHEEQVIQTYWVFGGMLINSKLWKT